MGEIEIRPATEADLPEVARIGLALHEAAGLTEWAPTDPDAGFEVFRRVLAMPDKAMLFVAVEGEKVVGACFVGLANFFFSPATTYAQEWLWWVDPEHRGKGIAKGMLEAVIEWARTVGAKALMLSSVVGVKGMQGFAMHEGFRQAEAIYMRRL